MPEWKPQPIWAGQDAFIIGGGPSLRGFDWPLLVRENTIGCNNAFRLGSDVCKVCLFVDRAFIFSAPGRPRLGFYDELARFPNPVVTNDTQLKGRTESWLRWMPRGIRGLHHDSLGYNFSCGASAINLALLLGATTVYLLGFDLHLDEKGRPNYHEYIIDQPSKDVYERMLDGFRYVHRDLLTKFPGRRVVNVNKNSGLKLFATADPDEFWAERKKLYERDTFTNQGRGRVASVIDTADRADAQEDTVSCQAAEG